MRKIDRGHIARISDRIAATPSVEFGNLLSPHGHYGYLGWRPADPNFLFWPRCADLGVTSSVGRMVSQASTFYEIELREVARGRI